MPAPRPVCSARVNFFLFLVILLDQLSRDILDGFSPNFQQVVGILTYIIDLAVIFRLLKGRCHGNQFWGKIAYSTFIRRTD